MLLAEEAGEPYDFDQENLAVLGFAAVLVMNDNRFPRLSLHRSLGIH